MAAMPHSVMSGMLCKDPGTAEVWVAGEDQPGESVVEENDREYARHCG